MVQVLDKYHCHKYEYVCSLKIHGLFQQLTVLE